MIGADDRKKWIPILLFLLLGGFLLQEAFVFPNGDNLNRITSDAEGYYGYLPAVFIYGNFEDIQLNPLQYPRYPGTDKFNMKTSCGVAILELPFFASAHLAASQKLFGAKVADGYSQTYSDAIVASSIFYVLLGMLLLHLALSQIFPWKMSLLGLLIILFGTNLYYYTVCLSGMSHPYSFFLFSWIIWLTPKIFDRPTICRFLLLGFIVGLAALVRLTNVVIILYPLLFGIANKSDVQERLLFLRQHLGKIFLAVIPFFATWIPQFMYWHHLTGNFWFYSYGDEGFLYWSSPKLWEIFFSVQNGLFIYSPLILLAFIGAGILAWKKIHQGPVVLLILLISSYAIASWWAWWFGAAFGHRAFVELYSILAIPMIYLLDQINKSSISVRIFAGILTISGIFYSLRLSYLYRAPWDGPEWSWATFAEVLSKLFDL